jgi:hypothetical protein
MSAVIRDHAPVVTLLCLRGADARIVNKVRCGALNVARYSISISAVSRLCVLFYAVLCASHDIQSPLFDPQDGWTVLMMASANGFRASVDVLVKKAKNVVVDHADSVSHCTHSNSFARGRAIRRAMAINCTA